MSKVVAAIVSLLVVACVCVLAQSIPALLAASGISALFLVLILVAIATTAGMDSRRDREGSKWLLRRVAPGLVVLLASGLAWGVPTPTSFNGVVSTLATGGFPPINPSGVAVDSLGNVFITDLGHNRIVEVTSAGVASVVSFPGVGAFNFPFAVAVGPTGNIYVADTVNSRVVELSGGVASVVDTGEILNPLGLTVDAAGNLYVSDTGDGTIVEVPAGGSAAVLTITGLGVPLSGPAGLAVDQSGNLYIADSGNSRVVEVTPGGAGSVVSISGLGTPLSLPYGVAIDGVGNLYIADQTNNYVVIVTPDGACTVLSAGSLSGPTGVAVSASGSVYIADEVDSLIVELQLTNVGFGNLPSQSATGTTLTLPFTVGSGITLGSAKVLTQGTANQDFTVVGAGTTCVTGLTTGGCALQISFMPANPGLSRGAAVLFDNGEPSAPIITVPLFGTADGPMAVFSPGTASLINPGKAGDISFPLQVALDGAGNMYVANSGDDNVLFVPAGGGNASIVPAGALGSVSGVAVDGAGNLFIADGTNNDIVEVTPAGVISVLSITGLSPGLNSPETLSLDAVGNLYTADNGNDRAVKITPVGVGSVVGTGSIALSHTGVVGVAVDPAGTVYIVDANNPSLVQVTAAGVATLLATPGAVVLQPNGVGVDANGNVYISDLGSADIVEVVAGVASVVQILGLSKPAGLNSARGVAVDGAGNIFIPDNQNNRLVEVNVTGVSMSFPDTVVGAVSSTETATVSNIGDQSLAFSANPTYTLNFPEDMSDENLCLMGTALAPGALCDVAVEFAPQSVGALSANIVLTNNNLNIVDATETVAASGNGLSAIDTTLVTVSTSPAAGLVGQPITVTAIVTDTTHMAVIPTGGVTLLDTVGTTSVPLNDGNAVTLDGTGTAAVSGAILSGAGTHTITANYAGVPSTFLASSNTTTISIAAPTSTVTTLNIAPGSSVAAGTVVTLTATVTAHSGITSFPLTQGSVTFCNAAAAHCEGAAIVGSAQLTSAGTAIIKLTPGAGTYSIAAALQPLNDIPVSTSTAQPLTVTATASYSSFTSIAASGTAADYTLTGTVTAFGVPLATGTVSFLDTTNGNAVLGSAALNAATLADVFIPSSGGPLPTAAAAYVVSGDFNNDGIADLAVLSQVTTGAINVFLGNGDGTFQTPVSYGVVGQYPDAMAVADLNGDGNLDLIVSADTNVNVLLGNGNGTFQAATLFPVGNNARFVAVGDFNHDGVPDLVVTNQGDSTVSVLLGLGNGTFQPQVTYSVPNPNGVAVGDFNHDGVLDLAVSGYAMGPLVDVLQGVGDGTFVQAQPFIDLPPGTGAYWLAAGDLRNNGTLDLVLPDGSNPAVYVLLGNNDGTFQTEVAYSVGAGPFGVSLGDVNGDGVLDLVVPDTGEDGSVSVLIGNGDGTFAAATDYSVGNNPTAVALADFNGDGLLDIATADNTSNTATILLGARTETAIATGVTEIGTSTYDVLASYPGDASRIASLSTTVTLTDVPLTVTATTVTAAPNPAIVGQSVTLTATVTPAPTGAPLGTVNFFDGVTLLGNSAVNSSGIATLSTSSLPVGADSITAVYSGNAGFATSTATSVSETVTLAPTTTTVVPVPNPAIVGQSVTLTATVAPAPTGAPLGTVNFLDGVTLLGSSAINSSGIATFNTSSLPVGADSITAVYSGNAGFATSTSIAVSETVTLAPTSTALTVLPNPVVFGQSATMTATVTPAPTGAPLGSVNFFDGVTLLGNGTVNSSGIATLSTSSLPVGADSITAVYSGNAGFATSTSTAVSETVTLAPTSTALTVLPNPVVFGQSATMTATVSPAPTGAPLGTVNFFNGATLLGNSAVNSSGIATLSTSSLPVGADSITAVYSGNAGFATSTSTAVSETVTLVATSTALTVLPNPVAFGQSATMTATVTPAPTGAPLGSVNFFNGVTLLGNGTVNSSGVATLSSSSLPVGADSITAVYSGNAGFATSTSTAVSETVTLAPTTTTVVPAPNPAIVGQSVTLTATVVPAPTGAPLGTVNFFDGATLLGNSAVNSSGVATLSTSSLPVGADSITAVYSGNAGFATSTSIAVSETVTLAATTTALTVLPNPVVFGQAATMTATVSPAPTGAPLGTVNFFNGATLLGNGAVNSSGVATLSTSSLPVGADSITAVYSGNAGFATSTSTAVSETVTLAPTTTTVVPAPNPAIVGQSVTLTATVAPAPTGAPLGTVNFFNGVTLLGNGTVNSSGIATLSTSSLPVGVDSITAVYSGNAGFATSTSIAVSETVTLAPTSTALTVLPNPVIFGQSATMTATVTPTPTGAPLGTVNFFDGATLLGNSALNSSGVATLSSSTLPVGADSITAVYLGNAGFATSTSIAVSEAVTLAPTSAALTVLPNPVVFGQSATMTATVSPAPTGAPLGTVNFFNGATLLGNGTVNSSGIATLSTSSLPVGADSITAVYSGNAGFAASTSTAVSETVTLVPTSTALTVLPNPLVFGQSVTMTATVSPAPTGAPLGTVTFFNGATLLGNGTVNSSGIATFSTSSLPVGTDSITAVYLGNAGFATSTSTAVSETVTLAPTTTTVVPAPNPAIVGQSVTLTATVSPAPTGAPLGAVNFFNGATLLGNGTVNSSGIASLSTSSLPVGADSITAVYSGNAGFATSTSIAVSETVTLAPTGTALTVLPNPLVFGHSATLTATVTPTPTGAPLGTVNFFDGATLLGNSTVNSSGIATFNTSSLPVGVDSITAVYSGNAGFATSTSTAVSETVTLAATTTTVIAAPNPAIVGQSATLTATVTPVPTGVPLGTVDFFDGATLLGNSTVNSSGIAILATSNLPVGADSITAVYSGNAAFAGSTSTAFTETVTLAPTTTTLIGAPNPDIVGQSVTLTATVVPAPTGAPLGTVNFFNGVTLLGNGTVNSSGVATLSTSSLPVGTDSMTAVYSGNAAFATSTSSAVSEMVTLDPTITALTVLPNPVVFGQSATMTATVTPSPTGAPLGSVNFFNGATLLGNGTVNSSGIASFTTITLPAGADSITAVYSGNAAFATSTSTAVSETVTLVVTATTLIAAPNPAIVGQSITLTAAVAPAPTGTPLGTVSFFNGATSLGNGTVNSSGIATLNTSSLPVGADSITAVYSGNAGFATSTSTAVGETVILVPTSTTLTVAPSPLFDGQTATLTAALSPVPTGTPAGSVNFYNGATLLGSGTVDSSGIATFSTITLPVGDDSLTAVYSGNGGFAASTSVAVIETVTPSFTVAAPTTPVTVAPGGAAAIDLTVPPLGGPFNSAVTLSASGLPPGATVTFNPPTVTPGSAGATSVMTIQLAVVGASNRGRDIPARHRGFPVAPFSLAIVLFGGVLGRKRIPRTLVLVLALAGLGTATALFTGCGGGFASSPSYTITIMGTSGSFEASTTMTLTVK